MDVVVTIILIAVFVAIEYSKVKKKIAAESKKKPVTEHDFFDEEDSLEEENFEEEIFLKNEKYETNSSKSQSYFTYETDSELETPVEQTKSSSFQKSNEIHLQEVENEIETNNLNLHDPEELKKAVLYGEILKNPYN